MPPAELDKTMSAPLMLPRIAAAIGVAAAACPALALPLALGCLGVLSYAAYAEALAAEPVPEGGPAETLEAGRADPSARRRQAARRRADRVAATSEDSFPASDPPSWTPVSGVGTRH